VRVHDVAERQRGVLLLRSVVAGFPPGRLPAGGSQLHRARTTVRALSGPQRPIAGLSRARTTKPTVAQITSLYAATAARVEAVVRSCRLAVDAERFRRAPWADGSW